MKRYFLHSQNEDGQAIIQVTISLVVLLGFLALAIDVGRVYAERRNMQNAADAGALAGARELCLGQEFPAAEAKAKEIMIANGVAESAIRAGVDITPDGSPPNIINTRARHPSLDPILGQLVEWGVIDVAATASAACGAATTGCGLWPVAFSKGIWDVFSDEEGAVTETRKIAIWNDENKNSDRQCAIDGVTHTNLCDCYECPKDTNGADKFLFVSTDGRAWLDFSSAVAPYTDVCAGGGYGAAELKCQLERDTAARIQLPQCIAGTSGNKAGVGKIINDYRIGDIIKIPLYDDMVCEAGGPGGGGSYNVSTVGCIQVVSWDKIGVKLTQKSIFPPKTYPDINASEKVLWATVKPDIACMSACGNTDGSDPIPGQLNAVNLIR